MSTAAGLHSASDIRLGRPTSLDFGETERKTWCERLLQLLSQQLRDHGSSSLPQPARWGEKTSLWRRTANTKHRMRCPHTVWTLDFLSACSCRNVRSAVWSRKIETKAADNRLLPMSGPPQKQWLQAAAGKCSVNAVRGVQPSRVEM